MAREIKFRGVRQDTGEVVYGSYVDSPTFGATIRCSNGMDYTVKDGSVNQYTGQKDVNGVDIYDGDIVNMEYGEAVVIWDNTTLSFRVDFYTDRDDLWLYKCEVIDNIHMENQH